MKSHQLLYEDFHFIICSKDAGTPVQKDKTGDCSLQEALEKQYKRKLYLITRLDRPVSGIVLFAKTKKAATTCSKLTVNRLLHKKYIAAVENEPSNKMGTLTDFLFKRNAKSYISKDQKEGKKAVLNYQLIKKSDNYYFLEIELESGRFHQIRAQLAHMGCPIKGDVKYGARRANKDRSIHLHAFSLKFHNPFKQEEIKISAPFPKEPLWTFFEGKQ